VASTSATAASARSITPSVSQGSRPAVHGAAESDVRAKGEWDEIDMLT